MRTCFSLGKGRDHCDLKIEIDTEEHRESLTFTSKVLKSLRALVSERGTYMQSTAEPCVTPGFIHEL